MRLRRLLALGLLLPASAPGADPPAPPPHPPGITERIVCRADAGQSYAVFLPAAYDPARRWPVVFCFDPRARGDLPVRLFATAAEKHGYMVAGSHNACNGPVADADAAALAMLRDVGERFAVDRSRVYLAGFSGGARLAARVALAGFGQAVIACGGGFPEGAPPPPRIAFDFLGIAGTADFNRDELRRIEEDLRGSFAAHRFEVFPGDHTWPPESQAETALAWLDARHRHAGVRARYRAFVAAFLQRHLAALGDEPAPVPHLVCSALLAHAEKWIDPAELRRRTRELGKALPDRSAARNLERRAKECLKEWIRETADTSAALATLARWRRQSFPGTAGDEGVVARCALVGAELHSLERAVVAVAEGRFAPDAVRWARLAAAAEPESPLLDYQLACVTALAGDHTGAAAQLGRLIGSGALGPADVAREPAFAGSLTDPAFQSLLRPAAR